MIYKIKRYLDLKSDQRRVSHVVNEYIWSHYSFWDVVTGRWSKIKLDNPYYKNRRKSKKSKGYRRPIHIQYL